MNVFVIIYFSQIIFLHISIYKEDENWYITTVNIRYVAMYQIKKLMISCNIFDWIISKKGRIA